MAKGRIETLWIKRARRGPMDSVASATLVEGRGAVGNADQGGRRQVTIVDADFWEALTRDLGAPVDPIARRANVLVRGVDLANSRGRTLRLGSCTIRIVNETRPCERMDEARSGLRAALSPPWGGGAYGEVVVGGEVRVGDDAGFEDASAEALADGGHLYDVERRARHAERPGFRISELQISPPQFVPWHAHSAIADTFYVLEGLVELSLRDPDETLRLQPGETYTVAAGRPHRVGNGGTASATFLVLQGIGTYDYLPLEPND